MHRPEPQRLALLAARRTLGLSIVLFFFYVAAGPLWGLPAPDAMDLLSIIAVVFLGVSLGVAFSLVWPLPYEKGFPRVFRTVLLTIPALGFGIAIQVFLEGAHGERAYWVIFALGAWLGSLFVREEESDVDDEGGGSLFGGWDRLRDDDPDS